MDYGFHFQVNDQSLFVPMDDMEDFVATVSLLDKLGPPKSWQALDRYRIGDCIATRIDGDGNPAKTAVGFRSIGPPADGRRLTGGGSSSRDC